MDIICKPSYDVVFWRKSEDEDWKQASLSYLIEIYEDEPYCQLKYWQPVKDESGKELYHLFTCDRCDAVTAALDPAHDFDFCPHCGRAVLK